MKILIVSATSLEISSLLKEFELIEKEGQKLRHYTYQNLEIDVLVAGVGMVSTAYWMGRYLEKYSYDIAINLGIAGSFDHSIPIGELCHVTTDGFPEMGAQDGEQFLSLLDLDLLEDDDFPWKNGAIENSTSIELNCLNELIKVSSVTVNTVHGEEGSIEEIRKSWNPQLENMEGASFLYCCLSSGIDCLQIRSVSNRVEVRDRSSWDIPLAVKNLNTFAIRMLDEINAQN